MGQNTGNSSNKSSQPPVGSARGVAPDQGKAPFTQKPESTTDHVSPPDDLAGSPNIPEENVRLSLVPPAGNTAEKDRAQAEWNDKLLKEGETRITHRKWLFRSVAIVSCILFGTFLYYLYWTGNHPYRYVDHMVLWLLAAMPMGSIFILVKLSNEPAESNKPTALMWPEEAIKIGNKIVDVFADVMKDKFTTKGGGGS